jgi:tetratricopeptide (TPR) repeat protein
MNRRATKARHLLAVTLLVLATALVFAPSVMGDFVWDDIPLIQTNALLRDFSALVRSLARPFWTDTMVLDETAAVLASYYRPVVTLAYGVQHQIFGDIAAGYHIVNVLLHVLCVVLAYFWLFRRLVRARGPEEGLRDDSSARFSAFIAAALFALHPTRPESVTWISGCTDLWMTFWLLCAAMAWEHGARATRLLVGGLTFLLAAFSKEPAFFLPLLLLADVWLLPHASARAQRDAMRALIPLVVLAAAALTLRFFLSAPKVGGPFDAGFADLAQRVLSSAGHYAWMTLAYTTPTLQAGLRLIGDEGAYVYPAWSLAAGAATLTLILALAVLAWRRPRARPYLADTLWWLVPLAPVFNVMPLHLNVLVAGRFLYWPLLGLAAIAARALLFALERGGTPRRAALALGGAAVLGCGFVTVRHLPTLLENESLWRYEHTLEPRNTLAAQSLAAVLRAKGRNDEALDVLLRTHALPTTARTPEIAESIALEAVEILLRATPDRDRVELFAVRTFYDSLARTGAAILSVRGVRIALAPSAPRLAKLLGKPLGYRLPRALVAMRLRLHEEAEALLRAMVRDFPYNLEAWGNLVLALGRQDKVEEARDAARRGLALRPNNALLRSAQAQLESVYRARESAKRLPEDEALLVKARTALELGAIEHAHALVTTRLRDAAPAPTALRALSRDIEARARDVGLLP